MSSVDLNFQSVDSSVDEPVSCTHLIQFPAASPPDVLKKIIEAQGLVNHGGGGYFKETDRSPLQFGIGPEGSVEAIDNNSNPNSVRNISTMISVMYTPDAPLGKFLKLKSRSLHILQQGKGQVVLIYPDGLIKSFKIGHDYKKGEISQWVVPSGVFKACYLLPNEEYHNGLLISEVVVPGFDFNDSELLSGKDQLTDLVGEEKAEALKFLL